MKLMTESIYIGHDMKRFNEIPDALNHEAFYSEDSWKDERVVEVL